MEVVINGLRLSSDGKILYGCTKDFKNEELVIPETVEVIEIKAFYNNSNLKKIKFNKNLKIIKNSAFSKTRIKAVTLPDSIEKMAQYAFTYISTAKAGAYGKPYEQATEINVNKGNSHYYSDGHCLYEYDGNDVKLIECFKNGLKELVIDEKTTKILKKAVYFCSMLEEITVPDSVKIICDEAFIKEKAKTGDFRKIHDIKKVYLGKGVEDIGNSNFEYLNRLDIYVKPFGWTVEVNEHNKVFKTFENGFIKNGDNGSILLKGFSKKTDDNQYSEERLIIPDGVTEIAPNAFYGFIFNKIKSVRFPQSLKKIGYAAFCECKGLEKIEIGANVDEIEEEAFAGCTRLKEIAIGGLNTKIAETSFEGVKRTLLKMVCEKGSTVEKYAESKKYKTQYITGEKINISFEHEKNNENIYESRTITQDPINEEVISKFDYKLIKSSKTAKISGYNGNEEEIVIPNYIDEYKVTDVHKDTFKNNKVIRKITWPDTATIIPKGAFYNCSNLEEIIIPDGVKRIEEKAFKNCISLTEIKIPSSIEIICEDAFICNGEHWDYIGLKKIFAEKNSYAQVYAQKNRIQLSLLDGSEEEKDAYSKYIFHEIYAGISLDYVYVAEENQVIKYEDKWYPIVMEIPNYILGKPVIELSKEFQSVDNRFIGIAEKLVIPENVQHIRRPLYEGGYYVELKKLEIDKNNEYIVCDDYCWYEEGGNVLTGCWKKNESYRKEKIDKYQVLDGTKEILKDALGGINKLDELSIPNTVKKIDDAAYRYGRICGVKIVGQIGSEAELWARRNGMGFVPNGVSVYEAMLTGITFDYCFDTNLDGIRIIRYIGEKTDKIIIPETIVGKKVVAVGGEDIHSERDVFKDSDVKEVVISKYVSVVAPEAFGCCNMLNTITVDEDNQVFKSLDGVLFDKNVSELLAFPVAKNNKSYIVPDTVIKIGKNSFAGMWDGWYESDRITNSTLEEIYLSSNLKVIDFCAFRLLKKLKTIHWNSSIERIEWGAFEGTAIEELTLPNSVEYIGKSSFACCNLSKVRIPKSVEIIEPMSFASVKEIEIYDNCIDGVDVKSFNAQTGKMNSGIGWVGIYSNEYDILDFTDCVRQFFANYYTVDNPRGRAIKNGRWFNHTITILNSKNDEIKFKIYMGGEGESKKIQRALACSWGPNATFDFHGVDDLFDEMKKMGNKYWYAKSRLEFPVNLDENKREKFESYTNRYANRVK